MKYDSKFGKWFLNITLKIMALVATAILVLFTIDLMFKLGLTHPLIVFAIPAAVALFLTALEAFTSEKVSKTQWVVFSVNIGLLIYSFLMLPSLEAIKVLNEAGVAQNFLEKLVSWAGSITIT